jgi:pimeloyl-ACP methyl ester carboxylesterase
MQPIAGYVSREAELRGVRFHWLEWGDAGAPAMVLLHGLTGHAHIWDHMAPALAERWHVLAPDQRGHGDTSHTETYSTQDFIDDLEALRSRWGIERFVLMGLSMGGHNAMAYAWAHPERVSRLIVIDIPPRLLPNRWPNREEQRRIAIEGHKPFASFEEAFANARLGNTTAPDENLAYRTRWNLREGDGGLVLTWDPRVQVRWEPEDLTSKLPSIKMPALLVRAGKTELFTHEQAAEMAASFGDGELAEVAESGHSIPTDAPDLLLPVIVDWLLHRSD